MRQSQHHHGRHGGGHHHYGRHPFGFHGRDGADREHRGGRGKRFLDHGDLRLVALKLIADKPRHGYDLIKALEEASGGAYTPSPGVIYPTLTLLEDMGYAAVSEAGGARKLYTITLEGQAQLEAGAAEVAAIFQRMEQSAARSNSLHPAILRAKENLRTALRIKISGGPLTEEQISAVARAMDDAAQAVERA